VPDTRFANVLPRYNAAPSQEVIDVCLPLKEFGGIYCTHMRNEAERVLDSLHESFDTARAIGVPLVIW